MDLITLEEYKNYKGVQMAKTTDDAKDTLLIGYVSAIVQTYLGIDTGASNTVTEIVALDYDTNSIYLNNYPIDSIVSVVETGRYTYDSTVSVPLTGTAAYTADLVNGVLYRQYTPGGFASWPVSPGQVTVIYQTSSQWSDPSDIPPDLKFAVIQLVDYYKNDEWRPSKATQGTSLVNNTTQTTDFPKHIQVILDRYNTSGYKYTENVRVTSR